MSNTKVLTILAYCIICWANTYQVFARDEGVYEVYICDVCGNEHKIAVR